VAARKATATIPIVMINVGDPVGLGLIASLARPGGNVTGSAFTVGTETFGKALELLKDAVPNLRHVAILSNPGNPVHPLVTRDIAVAARALGVQLQLLEARGPDEFDAAFAAMTKERVEALYVIADVLFVLHAARLADLAVKNRLPSMHQLRGDVVAGGLMSYGHNSADQYRGAATFVDKLLKGAKPTDLPVDQPTKFELLINLKTAKALGLTIPESLLARADEVIE
jgi:putative tryptophan/tyrosine transport system substrate-binding protein